MDRINEMYLEDPPSERDLYNMGRRGPMEAEVYEFDNYYVDRHTLPGISGIIDR